MVLLGTKGINDFIPSLRACTGRFRPMATAFFFTIFHRGLSLVLMPLGAVDPILNSIIQ